MECVDARKVGSDDHAVDPAELARMDHMWTAEIAAWYLARWSDGSMLAIRRGSGTEEHAWLIEDDVLAQAVHDHMLAAGVDLVEQGPRA